jgi:hypothetical protein
LIAFIQRQKTDETSAEFLFCHPHTKATCLAQYKLGEQLPTDIHEMLDFRDKQNTTKETRCNRQTVATQRHITSAVQMKIKYRIIHKRQVMIRLAQSA